MNFEVEIKDAPNDGSLFVPVGLASPPGILVLHGSEGGTSGWSHLKALWLAQCGFATYPLSYSKGGTAWKSGCIVDVDLDETERAFNYLHDVICHGSPVGLYGISRGAEHALLLASLMAMDATTKWMPEAVAVHASSDVVGGAFLNSQGDANRKRMKPWRWRGSYAGVLPGAPIQIERYEGALFLSHGTEDQTWSVERTKRLESRLASFGRKVETHYYEGQGHSLDRTMTNLQNKRLVAFFNRELKPSASENGKRCTEGRFEAKSADAPRLH